MLHLGGDGELAICINIGSRNLDRYNKVLGRTKNIPYLGTSKIY